MSLKYFILNLFNCRNNLLYIIFPCIHLNKILITKWRMRFKHMIGSTLLLWNFMELQRKYEIIFQNFTNFDRIKSRERIFYETVSLRLNLRPERDKETNFWLHRCW